MNTDSTTKPYLGFGNQKVGRAWTFSLPSLITCPGASPWCLTHCYAARLERIRPNCREKYAWNLLASLSTEDFVSSILRQIPDVPGLVRVHVCGDFFNAAYAKAWMTICRARPRLLAWTYTRSWTSDKLRPSLERLRARPNMQVLASCDPTMPSPPPGWRVAWIVGDSRARGLPCRAQQGTVASCLDCGYCFTAQTGDVVFRRH